MYYFYLMMPISTICGVCYIILCYLLCKYNKLVYSDYSIKYLELNKKFINKNNI